MSDPEELGWQQRLTDAERDALLVDIGRVSLAIGLPGPLPNSLPFGAGFGGASRSSPAERLALLGLLLPTLEQAAAQMARDPLTALVSTVRPVTPPVRARRVEASALLRAMRRGTADRMVEETAATATADAPENRAVLSFWTHLAQKAAALAAQADIEGEAEVAARAGDYAARLRRLAHAVWAKGTGRELHAWTRPITSRAAARADYARTFRARNRWQDALRLEAELPALILDSRDVWRLYETWCLFQTLDALRTLGFAPVRTDTLTPALLAVREGRLLWTLAPGGAWGISLRGPGGRTVRVAYNQTFAEGRESVSHAMQPDITLSSGGVRWVLDAKFKTYALPGAEGEDINQMHAYRDGIIDHNGTRVVARAWCLYAGRAGVPNRPHLTYSCALDPPVGALNLRPLAPETFTALCALLSLWLDMPTAAQPPSRHTAPELP